MRYTGKTAAAVIGLAVLASSVGVTPLASAEPLFTIDVTQAGGNVVANGAGSIDLTGLSFYETGHLVGSFTEPDLGALVLGGPPFALYDSYSGLSSPGSLGPGLGAGASSESGDLVGPDVAGKLPVLTVPAGYVSGDPLSDSATWDNTTLSNLGLTPGTYAYTWGSGDSLVVNIVPEPGSLTLLASALLGLGVVRRWRSRPAAVPLTSSRLSDHEPRPPTDPNP